MRLDMSVSLGTVIQAAVTVAAVFMAYSAIRERLVRIETQLDPLWKEFERRRGRQ